MDSIRLTPHQVNFFHMFGYVHLPGLLKDRIGDIDRAFEEVWQRRGIKHDGTKRTALIPFFDQHEGLLELLDDPRFEGAAASLVGEDFTWFASDGNYYYGDTAWHCDDWHEDKVFLKMALYLDPVTRETGALRIIPGSHILETYRKRLGTAVQNSMEEWGLSGRDVPAAALESQPGDVVCFNQNCLHASYGGSAARRMFTMNVCPHYEAERLHELRQTMETYARQGMDRMWGPRMYANAGPRRMRHLRQLLENDGHMKALADKARAEGKATHSLP